MSEWTEGVCGDGVAILRDGQPVTITELLVILNAREWRPIETLPQTGQALVTDDDPDEGDGYGSIEMVNCPMLADGRLLNQNSANYSRPGTWKWWHPVPPRKFSPPSQEGT